MSTPASAIQEFVDSCVAPGTQDRVPIVEVWKWMGGDCYAGTLIRLCLFSTHCLLIDNRIEPWLCQQHPLVRHYTYTRPQSHDAFVSIASLPPSDPNSLPVLAIHGSEDQHMVAAKHEAFMKVHTQAYPSSINMLMLIPLAKENLGNLEYWMLDGVGHAPFWEAKEKVNGIIRTWCERIMKERMSTD